MDDYAGIANEDYARIGEIYTARYQRRYREAHPEQVLKYRYAQYKRFCLEYEREHPREASEVLEKIFRR